MDDRLIDRPTKSSEVELSEAWLCIVSCRSSVTCYVLEAHRLLICMDRSCSWLPVQPSRYDFTTLISTTLLLSWLLLPWQLVIRLLTLWCDYTERVQRTERYNTSSTASHWTELNCLAFSHSFSRQHTCVLLTKLFAVNEISYFFVLSNSFGGSVV